MKEVGPGERELRVGRTRFQIWCELDQKGNIAQGNAETVPREGSSGGDDRKRMVT